MSSPVAAWRTRTGHAFAGAGEVLSVDVSAFSVDGISNVTFTITDSVGHTEIYVSTERQRRKANYYRTTADSPLTGGVLPRSFDTYGFDLKAQDFATGKITVSCVVNSSAGDSTVMDDLIAHNQETAPCAYTVYVNNQGNDSLDGLSSANAVQSIAVAVEKLRALNLVTTGDIGGGTIILESGPHRWCRADAATSPAANTWTSDHWWLTIHLSPGAYIRRELDNITLASPEADNKTQNDTDEILQVNGGPLSNQDVNILFLSDETNSSIHAYVAGKPLAIDTNTSGEVRIAFDGGSYNSPYSVAGNVGTSDIACNEGTSEIHIQACCMRINPGSDGSMGAESLQECVISDYVNSGLSIDSNDSSFINITIERFKFRDVDTLGWVDTDDAFGNVTVTSSLFPNGMDIVFGTGTMSHTSGDDFNLIDGLPAINSGSAMAISAVSLVMSPRWGLTLSGFGPNNSSPSSSAFRVLNAALDVDALNNIVGSITVENPSFNSSDVVASNATIRVAERLGTGAGTTYASLYPSRTGIDIAGSLSNVCLENIRLIGYNTGSAINTSSGSTISRSAIVNVGDAGSAGSSWAANMTDVTVRHCTFVSNTAVTGTLSGCEILRCVFDGHSLGSNWSTIDQCFFSSVNHIAPAGSTNSVSGTWFNQPPTSPLWLLKPMEANLGALSGGSAYSSVSARWVNAAGLSPLTAGVHADFGDGLFDDQESVTVISDLLMDASEAVMIEGSQAFTFIAIPAQTMAATRHGLVIGTGLGFLANAGEEGPRMISHDPRGLTGVTSIVLR